MSSFPLCAIFFSEYNHGMSVYFVYFSVSITMV